MRFVKNYDIFVWLEKVAFHPWHLCRAVSNVPLGVKRAVYVVWSRVYAYNIFLCIIDQMWYMESKLHYAHRGMILQCRCCDTKASPIVSVCLLLDLWRVFHLGTVDYTQATRIYIHHNIVIVYPLEDIKLSLSHIFENISSMLHSIYDTGAYFNIILK